MSTKGEANRPTHPKSFPTQVIAYSPALMLVQALFGTVIIYYGIGIAWQNLTVQEPIPYFDIGLSPSLNAAVGFFLLVIGIVLLNQAFRVYRIHQGPRRVTAGPYLPLPALTRTIAIEPGDTVILRKKRDEETTRCSVHLLRSSSGLDEPPEQIRIGGCSNEQRAAKLGRAIAAAFQLSTTIPLRKYCYEGLDKNGRKCRGEIEAEEETAQNVEDKLRAMGIQASKVTLLWDNSR